jgi:hypothetical protein
MASTDARLFPIKNTALRITFDLRLTDGALNVGATGLDSEISKDGGTIADCTNEATEIATTSGIYYLDLTSTEMNADTVAIKIKSTNTNNMDQVIVLYPHSLVEPAGVPTWPSNILTHLAWVLGLHRNKMTQTSTTTKLRNDADNADIASSTVSDVAGTYTKGEWT